MIAIFAAMEIELKSLLRESTVLTQKRWKDLRVFESEFEGTEIIFGVTGVGKSLTAAAVQKFLSEYDCSSCLFIGIAGAINPSYQIGDMVLAKDTAQWDLDATPFSFLRGQIPYTKHRILPSDRGLLEIALSYTPSECAIHVGRMLTGDTFLTRVEKQQRDFLRTELEGDAADMETASAALVAYLQNVPFLAYKVISDQVDGVVPKNFSRFIRRASDRLLELTRHIIRTVS